MSNIQKVSRLFCILFKILFYSAPLAPILFWYFFQKFPTSFSLHNLPVESSQIVFNHSSQILAILVSMLPTFIVMRGLKNLTVLFSNYEQGLIFTEENACCYKRLGYTIYAWVLFGWVYDLLISVVLTFQNSIDSEARIAKIILSTSDFTMLVVGGMIVLIAWIMQEGSKIADENAHTI